MGLGDKLYAFMGETIIEFTVTDFDEDRASGYDKDCTYCFYRKDCYRTKYQVVNGMKFALNRIVDELWPE